MERGAAPGGCLPEDDPRGSRALESGHCARPAHPVRVSSTRTAGFAGQPTARAPEATVVMVNDSPAPAQVASRLGGQVALPPWGFVVRGSSVRGVPGRELERPRLPRGSLVHDSRGRRARPYRMPTASGSSTASEIPGSTGEGRPTRFAARRRSRFPGESRASGWVVKRIASQSSSSSSSFHSWTPAAQPS